MSVIEVNTCRLCFSTSENNVNIFSVEESDGLTSIGRMIVDCLLSELEPNTGYPEIVCQLCQLQLNVFFEFKKKVFLNHDKFTAILRQAKTPKPAPLSKKCPQKSSVDDSSKIKRLTRSSVKVEQTSNLIDEFESVELTLPHTVDTDARSIKPSKDLKRLNDSEIDEPEIKFIKLEADTLELDDNASNLFRENGSDDETEQYLEEQYLDNYSENEDNTEVEYVYEDEVDDENCNSFKEEYLKGEDPEQGRHLKKVRKPKTPKVKKFITERVLDADTMKEYDAVKCLNCSEYFETMDKFTVHHKACDKTACPVCGKMLSSSGMDLHMKQHDSEKPYICSICNKGFTTAQQCSDHEFRHKNQRPFDCHMCEKTFKMKCDLRTHIMCHQDIRKHACPICGKRFRMRSHVTAHLETHNENNVFECTECGLMLKTSSSLKGHISQMHSTSYKHNCPVCSRGFAKLDRYKFCVQKFRDEFQLEKVAQLWSLPMEKAFRQLSHLRNHIETHASEHAYACEECGRTFKTKVTMQNHVRQMHTDQHEFECDICKRGFYRKNRLERHRQTHFRTPKRISGENDIKELQLSLES